MKHFFHTTMVSASVLVSLNLVSASFSAGNLRAISVISPLFSPGDTANGDSGAASFSGDGRYIIFLSLASNLATNSPTSGQLNLFRREIATGTTVLVSRPTHAPIASTSPVSDYSASSNGRWIAFSSEASTLTSGDTNGVSDVFVRDLLLNETYLVSVNATGKSGNLGSSSPSISADGNFVLFESRSSDLTPGDTNSTTDVFLRDRAAGTTTLISARTDGLSGDDRSSAILLNDDAEVILFLSEATDLVLDSTAVPTDLYVRRRSSGKTTRIELPGVLDVPGYSRLHTFNHALSSDGRYLAFRTEITAHANPGAGQQSFEGIWWVDLQQGSQIHVSGALRTGGFGPADNDFTGPVMTADGRSLAFEAQASNTAPTRVVIWNVDSGLHTLNELVTPGPPGSGSLEPETSYAPVLSPDGTRLAFETAAAVPGAGIGDSGEYRFYLRTLVTGAMKTPFPEISGGFEVPYPSFSPDGQSLLFQTTAELPGVKDQNQAADLYLSPLSLDRADLLTPHVPGAELLTVVGLSEIGEGGVSDDGYRVVFTSSADELVTHDHNGFSDVFVYDTRSCTNQLVSVGLDGESPDGSSGSPRISGDGRSVVFVSNARNLVAGVINPSREVFVRDLQTGRTVLASAKDNETTGTSSVGSSGNPVISADGRYVAFESTARDLVPNTTGVSGNVFLRDLKAGRTFLLSQNQLFGDRFVFLGGQSSGPVLSGDGLTVGFLAQRDLVFYSVRTATATLATTNSNVVSVTISADGKRAAFRTGRRSSSPVAGIYWRDLVAGTNQLIRADQASAKRFETLNLSGNGRRLAFTANLAVSSNGVAGPNGAYVFDIDSATLFDAGHPIHGAMPNGESDSPVLSADGRLVAFHSTAENLVGDDSNQTGDLFLRDLELDTVQLVSRQSNDGAIGNGPSNSPILSANGRTLGFRSEANNLTPGDYNFLGDLFVLTLPAIAPHLQFSAPPGPNRDFTVSFQSEPGVMYLLQAATSLAPGKFQSLESAFVGDGSIISRRVPIANESGYVRLIQTVRALPNE